MANEGGDARDNAYLNAVTVQGDIDYLLLGVQKDLPDENVPADTQKVANDCKGN